MKRGNEISSGKKPETMIKSSKEQQWLQRKEKWLVILGVILHAIYMLSIFDIYFKTPIVHGLDPVKPHFTPPAKRLVLLVADGLRADKFYEPDEKGNTRAPFLRGVIENQGRFGVSRARPPTESRPGHVALIAGFYEDPSAVTKGWKANPVEFDSVFNQSRHTFAFGSPDVVTIFCGALNHSTWKVFPPELEDFAVDASFLDEWAYDQFETLIKSSEKDEKLKKLLHQDNIVIFLHLFGCDSNGHAHRPYGSIYLNNVKVVDQIAKRVNTLLENYYNDKSTAYIFTADHGMSDKGSHGDGHPSNTDTPLVAWGAGIKHPMPVSNNYLQHTPTPSEWGLHDLERVDVNQADIAPLMSTLLGLPCPVNSVGNLPLGYINFEKEQEVEAVLANTQQILNQFLRKSQLKELYSLNFKPFKPLANYSSVLNRIENLISVKDYKAALNLTENLRTLALKGLDYFQTYDWLMLMSVITLGYTGWMIYIILHVLQSYTSLQKDEKVYSITNRWKVYLFGCGLMGLVSYLLFLEHSPPLYHAYTAVTIFLWIQIFIEYHFIKSLFQDLLKKDLYYFIKLITTCIISIIILELLVHSFTERKIYTWCFLVMGFSGTIYLYNYMTWKSRIPIYLCVTFCFLSLFTLMPSEIPDNTTLVIISGFFIILIGGLAIFMDMRYKDSIYWVGIVNHNKKKAKFPILFLLQALLVGLSSVMVSLSTSHRTEKQESLAIHQIIIWSIASFSLILPFFSNPGLLSRLNSIFLGFAPAFLLLSIGYEAVFYGALALALVAWILFENAHLHMRKSNTKITDRFLELSHMRIALTFMVFFNVAFFGTGNFASIASFEISSVYRFITIFSPFLMAALLIFKLMIPFGLVICAFSAITKLLKLPLLGCYFLVILCSDVMTIHFFFLVKNTGSWMEIGNTISHFGIMSAQVVFVLLLFAVTGIYTKDIKPRSIQESSRKVK